MRRVANCYNPFTYLLLLYLLLQNLTRTNLHKLSLRNTREETLLYAELNDPVINYNGRLSELGGIVNFLLTDDGPVHYALSVRLCRPKLITQFDDQRAVATFFKSRV